MYWWQKIIIADADEFWRMLKHDILLDFKNICWRSRLFADDKKYLLTLTKFCWCSRIFADAKLYLLTEKSNIPAKCLASRRPVIDWRAHPNCRKTKAETCLGRTFQQFDSHRLRSNTTTCVLRGSSRLPDLFRSRLSGTENSYGMETPLALF